MPDIREELMIFLAAVVTGMILRLSYRCISCFRQMMRHSYLVMGIEDLIFWVGCALYVFVQIYYTSDGSIRWYFVLGVVFGAYFCSLTLRFFGKMAKKIYVNLKTYFS
ncbi:MAG: spore cortex biosynthesis protein YabQ [Lachnospiraceae bacterium]